VCPTTLRSEATGGINIFLRRGLQSIPAPDGGMVFQVEGRGLGVLLDAEPRASDRRATFERDFDRGDCKSSSQLHLPGELTRGLDGTLVAGTLFFISARRNTGTDFAAAQGRTQRLRRKELNR